MKTVLLSALWSVREAALWSRLPVLSPGEEPEWLRRRVEQERELRALKADERAKRALNRVDRAERNWVARRLGLARD